MTPCGYHMVQEVLSEFLHHFHKGKKEFHNNIKDKNLLRSWTLLAPQQQWYWGRVGLHYASLKMSSNRTTYLCTSASNLINKKRHVMVYYSYCKIESNYCVGCNCNIMGQMVLLCTISNDCMAPYWGLRGTYVMSYQANANLKL